MAVLKLFGWDHEGGDDRLRMEGDQDEDLSQSGMSSETRWRRKTKGLRFGLWSRMCFGEQRYQSFRLLF